MTDPTSKYPHLGETAAALADAGAEERIQAIKAGFWIPYDRAKETLARMEELLGHPPIERMPNLMIIGASNNGKTQILTHFMAAHPIDPNPEGDAAVAPVILVDAPPTPDFGDLCMRILDAIKAPYKETASAADRLRTVKKILALVGTRMLLIDEIHNMLTGGRVKQREFRNALKDLGNGLRIAPVRNNPFPVLSHLSREDVERYRGAVSGGLWIFATPSAPTVWRTMLWLQD